MKNSLHTVSGWGRMLLVAVIALGATAAQAAVGPTLPHTSLEKAVRHELVMLPYFGVFDNLAYRVDGREVTLFGQVTRPTLRSSAENVVKRIEGVEAVHNNIEVLPLSPFDDRIRMSVARSIYGYGPLQRYGLNPVAPIRIIVKNGNVTLEGVVANEMDRNIANIRANGVSGVFSVQNNLQVERRG